MKSKVKRGALVHIPQSVILIDTDYGGPHEFKAQMTIPLSIRETTEPTIGVVTEVNEPWGYSRIWCNGDEWSVKTDEIYTIEGEVK